MRTHHLNDDPFPGLTINVKNDKDCIFCKHCNCMWDYIHGPYMFFCDLNRAECNGAKSSEEHTCELFEEANKEVNV